MIAMTLPLPVPRLTMTRAITAKITVGIAVNAPRIMKPVRAEIMPKTSAVTAAHFFFRCLDGCAVGGLCGGCLLGELRLLRCNRLRGVFRHESPHFVCGW